MRIFLSGVGFVIGILALVHFAGCGSSDTSSSALFSQPPTTSALEAGLATITKEELQEDLYALASDEFQGRGTGYDGDEISAQYIESQFAASGLLPMNEDGYRQKFGVNRGRGYSWNIVGYLPGTDPELKDEVIVIGAHYDHLGKSGSRIYNGADDNGSGTVAVMEVAEAFSTIKDQLKRTIVFIAFSGEEIGLVGSGYYTRNPLFSMSDTIYMVNLDMVGWLRNKNLKFLGGGSSTYMRNLINLVSERYPGINPYITSSAGGGSDHVPFIRANVPSVFLHSGSTDVYHTPSDTVEKVNYDGLTEITKVAFEMVWRINEKESRTPIDWRKPEETPEWNLDHGVTEFIK